MKFILSMLFALSVTFSNAQRINVTPKVVQPQKTSTVYIVEESWKPRQVDRWESVQPSYVQIVSGEYFVLSVNTRGKIDYFEGDITTWIENPNKLHFYVRGSSGAEFMSFDVTPSAYDIKTKELTHVNLHMYHMLGRYDKYYSAKIATKEELKELLNYIKK
jgi:hypothetical protein